MYEEARRYREDRKAKAERLASGDPHEKTDSSDWSPPEQLEANKKTGLKPVSPRQFRRGGKVHSVEGEYEHRRADRKPRASGGRSVANSIATTDEKAANKDEFGAEHIGALRHGGRARARKLYGGPLAPPLSAGYPGTGDVPAARMQFNNGPSQLSRAVGIKEGGKVKRAKGGRIGKFMGGGFGGMGAGQPGMAQPMAQAQPMGQGIGSMPNAGMGQLGGQLGGMPGMPQGSNWQQDIQSMMAPWQSKIAGMEQQMQGQMHPPPMSPNFQWPGGQGFEAAMMADRGLGGQGNRARGGKVSEGLKVEHRIVKKAKGGEVGHTELHHGDCRCAKCTGGMTKGGHVEHHHEDCTCAKCSGGEVREHRASGGGNWIAGATKNKGALHKALHVPEGEKIPAKKLSKAEHSKNPTMRKRADLAETLKGLKKADGGRIAGGIPQVRGNEVSQYRGGGNWYRKTLGSPEEAHAHASEISPDPGGMVHRMDVKNRPGHAKGGRAKGKQTVNIVIAPGGQHPSGLNPMAAPPQPPHPAQPIPMPSPPMPMGGGMPYPMPMPMGGGAPLPPQMGGLGGGMPPGMPPRPFKHGGYAGAKAGEGAGGGEGRLKKRRAYGKEARGAGPNQAV